MQKEGNEGGRLGVGYGGNGAKEGYVRSGEIWVVLGVVE